MDLIFGIIILLLIWIIRLTYLIRTERSEHKLLLENYHKLRSQKKQSEVVTGQVAETIAPFLDVFKHDPQKSQFLGKPIDFVVFEDDEIIFVEVKSQNAPLTPKQRKIRDLIKNKKVRWELVKIK
jgi:predicted Holliday junction resolvase-like endonuclease